MPYDLKLKKIPVKEHKDMDMPKMAMYPPSFHIDSKQMPEIKKWEVGGKYYLMVEVEQKSLNENEDSMSASFDIIAYKHMPEKSYDEMSDEEMEMEQAKALSNKKYE